MAKEGTEAQITVHMIGNAHIDPVWLWPLSEGRAEVLSTYRTALALLQEFEGYVFTSGGSVTYQWVAEDDPELLRAIHQAVAQGRWALANGWWLQPDCNIPSGESLARHALYGQRFLQENLGQRARVGYNVDSFGHAGTLPQLLKLGGLDSYVFFRPGPHEKVLPQGPFWWEAPGGARVLACRPPLHYCSPEDTNVMERMAAAAAEAPEGLPLVMCFYGVGNHGGGPTRRNVQAIVEAMCTGGAVKPVFSAPERYFNEVARLGRSWPVVHDDLQHHSRGCYTALSRVKRENRQAEQALMAAERLSALATIACDVPAATGRLRQAWQGVLLNQFHDILAGTSIREAYEDVWRNYERARNVAAEMQETALQALSARVHVADRGRPVIVWNPLAWERTDVVHLALPMGDWRHDVAGLRYPGQPIVEDSAGLQLPCQIVDVELDHNTYVVHLEARVTAPALGMRVLYVNLPETDVPSKAPQPTYADTLENGVYWLKLDPETGGLVSVWDLEQGMELLAGPAAVPLVIEDPSDTWSHDVRSFRKVIGRFQADGPAEWVQDGPVRRTLRVRSCWGRSKMTQEISLYPAVRAIDVTMTVDWHEQHKMLKLAFPLNLHDPQVTASAPYGWIVRQANGEEEPCQAWVDLSGRAGEKTQGLCLLNDSKYGYDALDNELRLSVLRSPIYAFHDPRKMVPGITYHYTDQGEQVLRYRLLPHVGQWGVANPARQSEELHQPLIARPVAAHQGTWQDLSLLRVAPEHVVLTTAKLAEEGDRFIVRGYEAAGKPAHLTLTSDLMGVSWSHDVGPHEIWTLALPLQGGEPEALNLLEEPLQS